MSNWMLDMPISNGYDFASPVQPNRLHASTAADNASHDRLQVSQAGRELHFHECLTSSTWADGKVIRQKVRQCSDVIGGYIHIQVSQLVTVSMHLTRIR